MSDQAQLAERFTDVMAKFTAFFGKRLPDDVLEKLEAMRRVQKSELATLVYDAMFTDLEMAKDETFPSARTPASFSTTSNSAQTSRSETNSKPA